jgi:hypothetical protein
MRNFWVFLTMAVGLTACDNTNEIVFEGPYHARFTESTSVVTENYKDPINFNRNEPISIQLHLAAPSQNNTTVIEFEVSGSAVENVDYVLESGENKQVLIPIGEHLGEINYFPINNRDQTGDKTIRFTITDVNNNLEAGFGETGINGRYHTVIIKDDDCLVDLRKFEGLWEFDQNDGQFTYEVEILVDWDAKNRIFIAGYTGLDPSLFAFANLDLCSGEFEIPEQLLAGSSQLGQTRSVGRGTFDSEVELINFAYSYDLAGPETVRTVVGRKKNGN